MDSIIHLLHSIQSTRLAAVGSATILVYDHLITIDQEIDLVWRKDWSFLKGVFIFHRYLGIVCTFWFHWEMWGYTVVVLASELVLLLWISVLYNRKKHILGFLEVLFVAELISVVVILAKSFARLQSSHCVMRFSISLILDQLRPILYLDLTFALWSTNQSSSTGTGFLCSCTTQLS
ncbi:hypothetical protein C8R44DRAFT_126104 [Mycena epipterygia]|nr:hypothetical protein C8R44DRAFT_126104 [Mycena epipterygia]